MTSDADETDAGSPERGAEVTLRDITRDTLHSVLALKVDDSQTKMVAANAVSIAQAHFSEEAWFRAIYAEKTAVGFAMLHCALEKGEYFLWRLMIDARYQKRGFGAAAMRLLIAHVRTLPGAKVFETSFVDLPGGPEGFYQQLGFKRTGELEEGEVLVRLHL